MLLQSFCAVNYRNIENAALHFAPGVNLLFGANAQGKTNVLEGIYTFARGKSFRGAVDEEQVRFGEKGFSIEIGFHSDGRDQTLSYRYYDGSRQRKKNGAPVRGRADMIGHFRAVLFCPEHLQLVKGGPAERRLFLNIAISQLNAEYLHLLSRYETVLGNRNSLLRAAQKTGYFDREQFSVWNAAMAELCADIALVRRDYIARLGAVAGGIMHDMTGGRETLSLAYLSDDGGRRSPVSDQTGAPCADETAKKAERERLIALYTDTLSASLPRECAAGCSLYGIHRDDMRILLCGTDARTFASQGQQRSAVLALKLAEGELSFRESGEYPVFLFDDVLSELDEERRAFVLAGAKDKQMIMTACETGGVEESAASVTEVRGGTYDSTHR